MPIYLDKRGCRDRGGCRWTVPASLGHMSVESDRPGPGNDLRRAFEMAIDDNEHANDALCEYLTVHRGNSRSVVNRLLTGEDTWGALDREDAARRRDGYLDAQRRFEDTRRELRMLVILWAKRIDGLSYRSMGPRLGISAQMAVKLGQEAAKKYPD